MTTHWISAESGCASRKLHILEELRGDIRYAFRQLGRAPIFTTMAALTLAIGVAANSTTFGLIDALMFRPPAHVREPERVGRIVGCSTYDEYKTLFQGAKTIDVAASRFGKVIYGRGLGAEEINVQSVTHRYFPLLGANLIAGRIFSQSEDAQGSDFVAIIGNSLWRRHFHGDFSAIGQNMLVGGRNFTIIGIAPENFRGVSQVPVDIWILLTQAPASLLDGHALSDPTNLTTVSTLARIRDGVLQTQVDSELKAVFSWFSAESQVPYRFSPIYQGGRRKDVLARGFDADPVSRTSMWLAGASLLVLMISCANVAGLLLIRSVERRHGIAIRMQLGAGRVRIAQQLLIETMLLTIFGGIASLAFLAWTVPLISKLFPNVEAVGVLNYRTLLITSIIAAVSILLIGIVPALQARRSHAIDALKQGINVVSPSSKFRDGLIIIQVALALALAVGAGLFVHSIWYMRNLYYGYDIEKVLLVTGDLSKQNFSRTEIDELFGLMLQRAEHLEVVESAAIGSLGVGERLYAGYFGRPLAGTSADGSASALEAVSPGYFAALGTRMLRGRTFMPSDTASSGPVAVVNESLAKRAWPGKDPIGQCAFLRPGGPCITVVGVSETRRRDSLVHTDQEWFIPLTQMPKEHRFLLPRTLYVRARTRPAAAAAVIKSELSFASAKMPFMKIMPMEDIFDNQARSWNLGASVFSLFGAMALILAGVGIYGTLAFSVRQRTAEIGLRMAMGALPLDILKLVLRQGLVLAAIGLAIGIAASMALSRIVQNLLFGIKSMDVVSFLAASAAVIIVAGAACMLPALRAMRIDPGIALRRE